MRTFACTTLVLLQLLICTIGQGVLTLCVRRDGSQHLEWTWASDCHAPRTPSQSACGHAHDHDKIADSTAPAWNCDPCTDYLLKAEPIITVATRYSDHFDQMQTLVCSLPIELVTGVPLFVLLLTHPPPNLGGPAIVVLRC